MSSPARIAIVLLAGLLGVELLVWTAHRRSAEEVRNALETGAPRESLFALHVLANRGATVPFDKQYARSMLASEHERVREYSMTWDVTRDAGRGPQRRHIATVEDRVEAERCRFLLDFQVTPPTLGALRGFYEGSARGLEVEGPGQ